MIRINLLPAGLRKRQSVGGGGGGGIPLDIPIALVGAVLVLLAAGFWAWIKWDRVPEAKTKLAQVTKARNAAEEKAKEVDRLKGEITKFEAKVNFLSDLIGRRVKWAHTLDDFCTLLGTDAWPVPVAAPVAGEQPDVAQSIATVGPAAPGESSLQVSCRKLSLKEESDAGGRGGARGGGAGSATKGKVLWSMDLSFQLVGREDARRGEYIKAFYDGLRRSEFWQKHDFIGDPEEFYGGDKWTEVKDMGMTECQQDLKPIRAQNIQSAAELTGARSAQGGRGRRPEAQPGTAPKAGG